MIVKLFRFIINSGLGTLLLVFSLLPSVTASGLYGNTTSNFNSTKEYSRVISIGELLNGARCHANESCITELLSVDIVEEYKRTHHMPTSVHKRSSSWFKIYALFVGNDPSGYIANAQDCEEWDDIQNDSSASCWADAINTGLMVASEIDAATEIGLGILKRRLASKKFTKLNKRSWYMRQAFGAGGMKMDACHPHGGQESLTAQYDWSDAYSQVMYLVNMAGTYLSASAYWAVMDTNNGCATIAMAAISYIPNEEFGNEFVSCHPEMWPPTICGHIQNEG
ncbi:hypothetical protein V1523DRAFT_399886 [Lipomyces doorenjongii]